MPARGPGVGGLGRSRIPGLDDDVLSTFLSSARAPVAASHAPCSGHVGPEYVGHAHPGGSGLHRVEWPRVPRVPRGREVRPRPPRRRGRSVTPPLGPPAQLARGEAKHQVPRVAVPYDAAEREDAPIQVLPDDGVSVPRTGLPEELRFGQVAERPFRALRCKRIDAERGGGPVPARWMLLERGVRDMPAM